MLRQCAAALATARMPLRRLAGPPMVARTATCRLVRVAGQRPSLAAGISRRFFLAQSVARAMCTAITSGKHARSLYSTEAPAPADAPAPTATVDLAALHAEGVQLITGKSRRKDVPAGLLRLRHTAAAGHAPSCNLLSWVYYAESALGRQVLDLEKGVVGADEAVALARRSAEMRDPEGLVLYGRMYSVGVSGILERNIGETARLFAEAAALGHAEAARCVKWNAYATTPYDCASEAEVHAAIDRGDDDAVRCYTERLRLAMELKSIEGETARKAVRGLLQAAESGSRAAQRGLAMLHWRTLLHEEDERSALPWVREELTTGTSEEQYDYGSMLCEGTRGATKDVAEGVEWLVRAGDAGHARALREAGVRLFRGEGVQMDMVRAVGLFRKAAELNDEWAMCMLVFALGQGKGVEYNIAEGFKWLHRVVTYHDPGAVFVDLLGMCYCGGVGVELDLQRGEELRRQAKDVEGPYALEPESGDE